MNAFTPRDYQQDCVLALANARAEGRNKALMVMASGLGKTYTVALDIEMYL